MRAKNGDVELHYDITGDGPLTIAFTHGIGSNGDGWGPLVSHLSDRYRCITWDVRGHSRSDKPETGYSLGIYASDLAAVLDAAGVERAVIAGMSMGGAITQRFILDYPERTIATIIMSTSSEVNEKGRQRWTNQAEFVEKHGYEAWLISQRPAHYTEEYLREHPEILEDEQRRIANNPDPKVFGQISRAVADYNMTKDLESVTVPALVLVGDQDTSTPPGGSVIISRHIPNSELHIIPGFGHGLYRDDAEHVGQLISEFLERRLAGVTTA